MNANDSVKDKYVEERTTSKGTCKRPRKSKGNKRLQKSRQYSPKGNDPAWYAADPAILRDVASIPYSWSMGTSIDMKYPTDVAPYFSYMPGIQVMWTLPSFGRSADSSSALNVASTSMYTWVRHNNSGHANYDQNDLMLYVGAMSSVYSYLNFLFRTYGTATLFSQKNRYLPELLLTSQRIDYNSIANNLANFRAGINMLVNKAASLAVPADIPYFRRQAFMYQNVYTEGDVKDQIYLFAPERFYRFTLDADGAGKLECPSFYYYGSSPEAKTWEDLLKFGNWMLAPIVGDEDFNIMSGDIMKAYEGRIITLNSLPEVYPIVPLKDEAVLEQMQNAIVTGVSSNTLDVVQNSAKTALISLPAISVPRGNTYASTVESKLVGFYAGNKILTTTVADPGPDVTIENTRLMVGTMNYEETETTRSIQLVPGSDMVMRVLWWGYADGPSHSRMTQTVEYSRAFIGIDLDDSTDIAPITLQRIEFISKFKYRPEITFISYRHGTTSPAVQYNKRFHSLWSVDNYAVLDAQDRCKINDAALLNLLNVPRIAKNTGRV